MLAEERVFFLLHEKKDSQTSAKYLTRTRAKAAYATGGLRDH